MPSSSPSTTVAPGVRVLRIPATGPIAQTLCYLLPNQSGDVHVVDPGEDTAEGRALLQSALEEVAGSAGRVSGITVTHHHADHLGAARWLGATTGAPVVLHEFELEDLRSGATRGRYHASPEELADRWGVPATEVQRLGPSNPRRGLTAPENVRSVADGDPLPLVDEDVRVLHTPGHTRGHLCLVLPRQRLVLTGDHVLPHINPGIGLGGAWRTNAVTDYLASLDRLNPYRQYRGAPGHGELFDGVGGRADELRGHVLARSREVGRAARELGGDAPVWALAERVTWGGGWSALRGFRLRSALAQTELYRDFLGQSTPSAVVADAG